ncbi:MAG TPA: hypothetical protein VIL36_02985 [Acidimicrobiales bacterium]
MEGSGLLGGPDFLAYLVLALGGAMAAGSVMALVRPPEKPKEGDLEAAPVARSIFMAVLGGVAALWALATLVAG